MKSCFMNGHQTGMMLQISNLFLAAGSFAFAARMSFLRFLKNINHPINYIIPLNRRLIKQNAVRQKTLTPDSSICALNAAGKFLSTTIQFISDKPAKV